MNPQPVPFEEKLAEAQKSANSRLCIGLDPDPEKLPQELLDLPADDAVTRFCLEIILSTADVACAFKPNLAFFEILGESGWSVLRRVVEAVPSDRLVIADAKRGDIGNSARMYARALFEGLGCTACTVSPYMGSDAVIPFLEYAGRGVFVLARTSNPGAGDLQDLITDGRPVYEHLARLLPGWAENRPGTAGIVAGATDLVSLKRLRTLLPDMPFLIPGVGAQGGRVEDVMSAVAGGPFLVNSSRQILYASAGGDYAAAARQEAQKLARALRLN